VVVAYHKLGSGPALLLVPPEHASMTSWDPAVVQALAKQYTVVLFDPPSVGYSPPDPSVRSIQALADVTGGLLAGLGLSEATVLGWGMGGQVALSLAERHPGLVGRLVLVDATAGGPGAPRPPAAVTKLLASPSTTTAELVALELASPTARTALLERMAAYAPDDLTTAAVRQEAAIEAGSYRDPTVAADLGRIRAPALVVTGGRDAVIPPAASQALAARLRHARRLLLPAAGYGVLTQDEARVVAAIEAFTR
jgi:pimeloyl-ACP methyl ester carboxylesterase